MRITGAAPDGALRPEGTRNPTLTEKEALELGFTKDEYRQAQHHFRIAIEHHRRLATPRNQWEPTPHQGELIASDFIEEGEEQLTESLQIEVDPLADEMQEVLSSVDAEIDRLQGLQQPTSTPESGTTHSTAHAVDLVHNHDKTIEQDESASKVHHRRSPEWLRSIAPWMPWLELAGFLFFVTYFLNVPLLQPWKDLGASTLAVSIVVVTILGQTALVHHGAKSHNHGREAFAEGNRHEGEKAFRRRNWYLTSAAAAAAAITLGMVLRAINTLGSGAGLGTHIFMIFVALVSGVIMPVLAYLAAALDGSKVSRERDHLVASLDDDLASYTMAVDQSRESLGETAENYDLLRTKVLPDICDQVQTIVDGAYRPYRLVRLLIGGLSDKPLARSTPTLIREPHAGVWQGHIGTQIPGAQTVNLKPLIDRVTRLNELEALRQDLLQRLNALPNHPWGTSRTN